MTRRPGDQPWRTTSSGLALSVRLTPRAGRDQVIGLGTSADGPHVAVKVRAVPEKGAANAALETVLADWLGLAPRDVRLVSGPRSRLKVVEVAGDPAALAERMRRLLGA